MPRPKLAIRPVEKTVNIPTDLCTKVDLLLFSELEGRVPHGAWSKYVCGLIDFDLKLRASQKAIKEQEPLPKDHK